MSFSVVAWGDLAESLHRKVRRKDRLFIFGKLRIRTWKQGGVNHIRPEIHLESYHLMQGTARYPPETTDELENQPYDAVG